MKKLALVVLVALVGMSASAQKGKMAVGLSGVFSPCVESGADWKPFGVAGKLQYGFTDNFRGELNLGYDFKHHGADMLTAAVNLHYLFNVAESFNIYPVVGVGYGRYLISESELGVNRVIANAGIGAEYWLSDSFALNLEAKFQYVKDLKRIPISFGFAYKF